MKKVDSLKNRLSKALSIKKMKAITLSEQTGIPKSGISQYLKGICKPKDDNTRKIAQILNIDEAWLQGYDVPMNSEAEPILPDSEQKWEIKHNGMFTELYFNGTLIKNLKAIEFKHRVNESGKAELPILKLEVIVAQELKGAFDQDKAIKTATLESEVYKYFKK